MRDGAEASTRNIPKYRGAYTPKKKDTQKVYLIKWEKNEGNDLVVSAPAPFLGRTCT